MRMLVIDDDARTRSFVAAGLRERGQGVDEAATGPEGLDLLLAGGYGAAVVDRMLPGCSGLELVRAAREAGIGTPVLMLTALGAVSDRVDGLEAGADDYLVKPFAFSELWARLQALVRRPPLAPKPDHYRVADLEIDVAAHKVTRGGRPIALTRHEFHLLERLAQNAGRAVSRSMLLESLWGFQMEPRANLIDAHVSRLRAKIDRGFEVELIHTIRGIGYVLESRG